MSTLFDPGPVDESTLTERQAHALAELRRSREPLPAGDIGYAVHSTFGNHRADGPCRFCKPTGLELLRALQARGLASRTKHGLWRAAGVSAPSAQGDLPEGF